MLHQISLSRSGKTITINGIQLSNSGRFPLALKDTGMISFDSESIDNEDIISEFVQSAQMTEILDELRFEKENAQIAKDQRNTEMQLIGNNIENESAANILRYVSHISKSDCGWQGAEILIGKNKLAEMLLNYFGCSFTATPYDDGQIFCKSENGKRLTLKRSQYSTISAALNLF